MKQNNDIKYITTKHCVLCVSMCHMMLLQFISTYGKIASLYKITAAATEDWIVKYNFTAPQSNYYRNITRERNNTICLRAGVRACVRDCECLTCSLYLSPFLSVCVCMYLFKCMHACMHVRLCKSEWRVCEFV